MTRPRAGSNWPVTCYRPPIKHNTFSHNICYTGTLLGHEGPNGRGSMEICKYINCRSAYGGGKLQEKSIYLDLFNPSHTSSGGGGGGRTNPGGGGGGVKLILIYDPKSTNSHTQRYRFNVLTLAKYDFWRAETVRSFIKHTAGWVSIVRRL
ncbi:hypothetical protein QTP88_008317 [Uroleucon formosanum]